jgi:hypothetical protein
MHYLERLLRNGFWGVAIVSLLLNCLPAAAAETVVLKYRIFRESISVPELTTFTQTGELSESLRSYLDLTKQDPQNMRRTLTQEINVNPLVLYQVLNSRFGETLLDQVSQVVHTPSNGASRQALRGAIVSSALPDGKINLIEILQNYPTAEVDLEGDRLAEVYGQINRLARRIPRL